MKKTFAAAALALSLGLLLTACGAPKTAEELIERTNAALEKTPCTESTSHAEMTFSMTVLGAGVDSTTTMEEHGFYSAEPAMAHVTSTTTVDGVTESKPVESEYYVQTEDGVPTAYTLAGGTWSRQTENVPALKAGVFLPTADLAFDPEAAEELNGTRVYVLTGTANAADMGAEVAEMIAEGEAQEVEMDVSALTADVKLYINAKTFLPVRMEGTLHGLNEALQQYIDSQIDAAMGDASDVLDLFEGADLSGIFSMEISDVVFVYDYLSYTPGEAIALPEEAKAAA